MVCKTEKTMRKLICVVLALLSASVMSAQEPEFETRS